MDYKKKFIIIGNMNAIAYNEIIPYITRNQIMYGYSIHSGDREFQVPDTYNRTDKYRIDANGIKYIRVNGVRWFTNMRLQDYNDKLILFKKYIPEEYPK